MRRYVRRERPVGWGALAAILTLTVLASALASGSAPVHAQAGVFPLPADPGTVWSIVGGYNTGSHSGDDPHALDIVREDASTAGSLVRAPVSGTISFVSSECLTINNGAGLAVLLCHLFPEPGLFRGLPVREGDLLGTVAPAYFASNGGLPHIHLAVHQTRGSGLIQGSIPLIGAWALEGIALPWTGEFNAHAGTRFVSSNGRNPAPAPAPAPGPPPPAPDPVEPLPGPTIDESFSLEVLQPGWNAVGWTARTNAAEIAEALGEGGGVLFTFDGASQRFRRFGRDVPASLNDLTVLEDGDGVLIYVDDASGAVLPRPPLGEPRAQILNEGFNLVAWTGAEASVAEAARSLGAALVAAFAWDALEQRYRVYRPGQAVISDLDVVRPGQALWLLLDADAVWDPNAEGPVALPTEPPAPGPEEPPPVEEGDAPPEPDLAQVLGPVCLNLRPAPTTIGTTPILCLAPGTVLEVLEGAARDGTGRAWMEVRTLGVSGWVASEFTRPFDPETIAEDGNGGVDLEGPPGDTLDGVASYYHPSLAGNVMYCGGIYNPTDATIAASTTYSCGTQLRVWRGNVFVDVVVQDTGLLPANHIDLSEAAYNQLGLPAEGIIPVRIEVLALPGG
ncbi:MAG: Rare lipoprotein A [Chloroflexi bacterium]|nr:MAG: Rare lipoprotein A [Chloroflexota bacterium]